MSDYISAEIASFLYNLESYSKSFGNVKILRLTEDLTTVLYYEDEVVAFFGQNFHISFKRKDIKITACIGVEEVDITPSHLHYL